MTKHVDPNLWDAAKAVQRGNFIAIESYLQKQEKSQSNLTPKVTRERRTKPKVDRSKEIIKSEQK